MKDDSTMTNYKSMWCRTKLRNSACLRLTRLVPEAVLNSFLSSHMIPHAATSAHFPPEQTTRVAGSWSMTAAMAREFQREYYN